jgi:two-component system response regulator FlrC
LRRHAWPGNVRELENVMQRAVILATGDTVEAEALRLTAPPIVRTPPPIPAAPVSAEISKTGNMRDLEREHILETLAAAGGSRKLTGERLGMSERTLRHKLKQYRDAGWLKE